MTSGKLLSILQQLRQSGQMTRYDIAHHLDISHSMASKLAVELISKGLVREAGRSGAPSGRPSDLLALNATAAYIVGLDIRGVQQRAVVVDLLGDVIASITQSHGLLVSRQDDLNLINDLVRRAIIEADVPLEKVVGLGVSVWGSVDPQAGVIYSWTETPDLTSTFKDFALRQALADHWSFPHILLDDTVRTMGLAEVLYGNPKAREGDFVYALADTGIGIAIMIGGLPYVGSSQLAGEIGHIPIPGGTLPCNCGNIGCLETLSSVTAILALTRRRMTESNIESSMRELFPSLTIQQVIDAAENGDKLAYQILTDAGEHFGSALAITLNILGPRLIVIGGVLSVSRVFTEAAQRIIRLQALPKATRLMSLESSQLDDLASARGAASQVLNALFNSGENNLLAL